MKNAHFSRCGRSHSAKAGLMLAAAAASFALNRTASGITATWLGSNPDANWSEAASWSTNPLVPGNDTGLTNNGDTAVFNNSTGVSTTTVNLNVANWNISTITFTSANANGFAIGSVAAGANSLVLSSGGEILEDGTVASPSSELINAPVVVEGNVTFENDSATTTSGVKFNNNVSGGVAGPVTITLQGTNSTGATSSNDEFLGTITNGSSSSLGIVKTGTGTWQLGSTAATSGVSTYTGATTINAGTLVVAGTGSEISAATDVIVEPGANFTNDATLATIHSLTVGPSGNNLASSSATAVLDIANNSGPALTINGQGDSTTATLVSMNIDLTGTGGIISLLNSAYNTHFSFEGTGKTLDLGTTSHLFYVNAGSANSTGTSGATTDVQLNGLLSSDSSSGGIIKSGNGTLKLQVGAGTNFPNFSGPIEVQEGVFKLTGNENNQLAGSNTLLIDGGNFFPDASAAGTGDVTVASFTATSGSITESTGGLSNYVFAPTYNFNIAPGTTAFSVGCSLGNFSANTVVVSALTSAVNISGGGQVTLSGNSNNYSGGTNVNGSTLLANMTFSATAGTLASGNPLGSGAVNLNGATLSLDPGISTGAGFLISYSVPTVNYGGGVTLNVKGNVTSSLAAGQTQNNLSITLGSLARSGDGTVVIAPAGGTAASNLGVNEIVKVTAAPAPVNGIVNPSIVGENNDASASGDFLNYNNTSGFILATYSAATNINAAGANGVYNANSSGNGTNNNSVSGVTTVYALNSAGETIDANGGTLTVGTGAGQAGVILDGGSIINSGFNGGLNFGGAEGTVYTSKAGASISANITGTGGFTVFGPGTLTLSGSNTGLTGGLNINQGTLSVGADSSLGSSSNPISFGGGTLQFAGSFNPASTHAITINAGNGTIDTETNTITIGSAIGGAGNLAKVGAGTLILSNANSYGGTTISAGNLQVNSGGSLGTGNVVDNGGLIFNSSGSPSVTGTISGSGTVTQSDSGTVALSGSNTYAGVTTITNGTIQAGNANALGFAGASAGLNTPVAVATVNSTGTLDLDGQLINKPVVLNGGTLTNSTGSGGLSSGVGGYILTSAGSGVSADLTSVTGGGANAGGASAKLLLALTQASITAVTAAGTGYTAAPTVTVTGGGGTGATAVATLNGSGGVASITLTNGGIGYYGTPTFSLSGGGGGSGATVTANANNFTAVGIQAISPGSGYTTAPSIVAVGIDSSAGTLTEVLPTANAVLNTLSVQASSTINGNGAISLNAVNGAASSGTATLTLGGSSASNAINGPITDGTAGGKLAISKTQTSTWTLNSANTYTGGTTVASGGTLIAAVNNALPVGGAVSNNGTLDANGNATIPGITGAGTLNIGSAATVQLTQNTGASAQNVLNIATGGELDLTNDRMFISYGGGSDPITSIAAWIDSGANVVGGVPTWTGAGITSSLLNTTILGNDAKSYGIGYADSANPNNPAGLPANTIEIRFTLLGDANLDGKVNGTDFNILAANFNTGGDSWDQGDFTYDGKVNGSDFNVLAANFNQGATLSSANMTALDSFASANGIDLTSSVPEPATTGILTLAALGVLARRRRKVNAELSHAP